MQANKFFPIFGKIFPADSSCAVQRTDRARNWRIGRRCRSTTTIHATRKSLIRNLRASRCDAIADGPVHWPGRAANPEVKILCDLFPGLVDALHYERLKKTRCVQSVGPDIAHLLLMMCVYSVPGLHRAHGSLQFGRRNEAGTVQQVLSICQITTSLVAFVRENDKPLRPIHSS